MYKEEAAALLKVSTQTVKRWSVIGKIRWERGENGKRIYWDEDVYKLIGKRLDKESWVIAYVRVAGTTESDRQVMAEQQETISAWSASKGMVLDKLYEDWAPATEMSIDKRPGLHQLLQDVIQGRVRIILIDTLDRLARIGHELITEIFRYYGVELIVINKAIKKPAYLAEQERDLTTLLRKAGVDRLDQLGAETLPVPKKVKIQHPGRITPNWEGEPLPPTSRDLSELM